MKKTILHTLCHLLFLSSTFAQGLSLVKDINNNQIGSLQGLTYLTNCNNTLFFAANDGTNGIELWKSNGTANGTSLVKNIAAGSVSSNPQNFKTNGNILFFTANDGINGIELWRSDGTAFGTFSVTDVNGSGNLNPQNLTIVGNFLFFTANDGINGLELWRSDGTSSGTFMVTDIDSEYQNPSISSLTLSNGLLFFNLRYSTSTSVISEFWRTNGTISGTNPFNFPFIDIGYSMVAINNTLFFSADSIGYNSGVVYRKKTGLFKTDGTGAGTVRVKDIDTSSTSSSTLIAFTKVNNTLFFLANKLNSYELWKSDGTEAGTEMLHDFNPVSGNLIPTNFTNLNGTLCFSANGDELWSSNGTIEGTLLIKKSTRGNSQGSLSSFTPVNGKLFFSWDESSSTGRELWTYTPGNLPYLVKDITVGANSSINVNGSSSFINRNGNNLFFTATNGSNGNELWESNGSLNNANMVGDIYSGFVSSTPNELTIMNGDLYFTANNGINGRELWVHKYYTSQEINIKGNNVSIESGDVTPSTVDQTDFGSVAESSGTIVRTFTIENLGIANLTLSGSPLVSISGANASDFVVTTLPTTTVIPSGSTTFQITFDPSAFGARTATLSIANNDSDENPYTFAIQGSGTGTEINLKGNNLSIASGDVIPSTNDYTDFGSVLTSSGANVRTFTIENLGTENLTLSGSPLVNITGAGANDFVVTTLPLTPVVPSGSTTFQITFDPSTDGLRIATLSIANNDSNENPYTFTIQGTGTGTTTPFITSPNPVICGTNTNAVLTASPSGTYQWSFCATEFGTYSNISGATSNTHTTTTLGFYKVAVNSVLSPAFRVNNNAYAIIKNVSGNTNSININSGGSADLYINFYGLPPFTASLLSAGTIITTITSNTNLKIQNVAPEVSRNFYLINVQGACGAGGQSNTIQVNVAPNPEFTIGTVATTACNGGFIQVPTTRTGNWGTNGFERISAYLFTSSGTFVGITPTSDYTNSIMNIQLPSNLIVGSTYKLSISPLIPTINSVFSSNFTITNSCPEPPSAIIDERNSVCNFPILKAYPRGSGYTFQWKKNGVNIPGATSDTYNAPQSDNYSVVIQNSSLGYNSISPTKAVTVYAPTPPTISCPNPILCGTNTSTTLTSSYTGAGFTYTWRKSGVVIPGATGPSITVSEAGNYYVYIVNNIGCSSYSADGIKVSYSGAGTLLNSNDNNDDVFMVSPQTTENLRVNLTGTAPWEVGLSDGNTIRTYIANASPLIIPVSPTSPTNYSINYVSSACGVNKNYTPTVSVGIAPTPNISFPTPSNLTVCRGNTIDVPYSVTGNLGSKLELSVLLGDPTGGESRSVYTFTPISLDPLQTSGTIPIYIPNDITLGSYAIIFGASVVKLGPAGGGVWTNYALNVVNSGCPPTPAPTISGRSSGCESVVLNATPFVGFGGAGSNTYQWYKNGVALAGKTNPQFTVYESGNYTVNVINGAYNQTSAAKTVTINRIIPTVSASNPVICGSNTSTTLSTNYTGVGYTYQWYIDRNYSNSTTEQIPIFGETNSSLTVSNAGGYSVRVFDGACLQNSKSSTVDASGSLVPTAAFAITNTATAKLTNLAGDNTAVTIGGTTTSASLRVNFTGGGPWSFDLVGSDGNTRAYPNVASQVFDFVVSPVINTNYNIANLTSSCGIGLSSGSLTVIVSPPPSFTINATSTFGLIEGQNQENKGLLANNICAGSSISIDYATIGNWSADRNITVELVNASTNAVIAGTTQQGYNTNPILYFVPYNVPLGTYKLKLSSTKPFIESSVLSSTISITNTACSTPQATIRSKGSCSSSLLSARPSGSGFTYQWFNGAALIPNAISSDYNATADGNYSVTITNAAQGYTATSAVYVVAIEEINSTITASSGSICNAGGNVTFTSNNVGGSYTHQWYSSSDNVFFSPISGATTNTYSATTAGYYNVIIKNGGCELKSNTLNTCVASINFSTKTVCANAGVNVPFSFSGGENQAITIQLVDATTNAVVQANLLTVNSTIATLYNPTVNIPNSVTAGTYKFKLITVAPSNVSLISSGILTVSNQTGGIAPIVSASIGSVNSQQNVTITAIGCVGDITWNNTDQIVQSFPSFTSLVSKNTTYSAICKDFATGCVSAEGSTTVTYSCTDAYEPNNSIVAATAIAPNTFTSPVLCLNGFDNPDWFSWSLNGHVYYIKTALTSSQVSAGNYRLKLTYDNANLTIETMPETVGQSLDTYLTLFDTDGVTILSMNDNENGNGFSKIIYGLANINPCVSALTLNNITDDISTGTITKEANATTGTITATNKITGTANVTYQAGKSIQLDPGFIADNGVVFKTEFGGCN